MPPWICIRSLEMSPEYSSFSCTRARTHLLRMEDEMCALVNLRSCSNLSPALIHAVDLLLLNHISRKTHTTFCTTAKPPWVFVEIYIMTLALSQTTACFLLLHVLMSLWILAQLDNMTTTVLSVMTQELLSTAELSQRSPELLSGTPQYSYYSTEADRKLSNTTEIPRVTYEYTQRRTLKLQIDCTLVVAEVTISSRITVVTMMAVLDGSSLAWKPPWICYQDLQRYLSG